MMGFSAMLASRVPSTDRVRLSAGEPWLSGREKRMTHSPSPRESKSHVWRLAEVSAIGLLLLGVLALSFRPGEAEALWPELVPTGVPHSRTVPASSPRFASSEPPVPVPSTPALGTPKKLSLPPIGPDELLRVRARDCSNGAPVRGLSLRCISGEAKAVVITDGDGIATAPARGMWSFVPDAPEYRELRAARTQVGEGGERVIWVYRFRRVRGRVIPERPERIPERGIQVAALPTANAGGFRRDSGPGTLQWLESVTCEETFPWRTTAGPDGEFQLEVPLMDSMTLSASAPGHITETLPLGRWQSADTGRPEEHRLPLRASEGIRLFVVDEAGTPLEGATIHLVSTALVSTAGLNLEELRVRAHASRVGFGAVSNDATGLTRVQFQAGGRSNELGRSDIAQPSSGASLHLVVSAPSYQPHVEARPADGELREAVVVLRKVVPARSDYRLSWKGRFASPGSTIQLCEPLEGGTIALQVVKSNLEGTFPAVSIVPGHLYTVVLFDQGGVGTISGDVRFGTEEIVDISHFD